MKQYKANNGGFGLNISLTDEWANIAGRFIEETFRDKKITPLELLDSAKSKKSPIHDFFEWNDGIAAEKYRIHQARTILNSISIVVDDGPPIKAYFNLINENSDRVYLTLETAQADENLWSQVVESALRELEHWRERYKTYKELSLITKDLEKNIHKIRSKYVSD